MSRILVIDDEPALGENIERMLRAPDVVVSVFVDPVKGLAECIANPPDLVLLDVRMPGMSGEEVLRGFTKPIPDFPLSSSLHSGQWRAQYSPCAMAPSTT